MIIPLARVHWTSQQQNAHLTCATFHWLTAQMILGLNELHAVVYHSVLSVTVRKPKPRYFSNAEQNQYRGILDVTNGFGLSVFPLLQKCCH